MAFQKLSIVVPCFNEDKMVASIVARVQSAPTRSLEK